MTETAGRDVSKWVDLVSAGVQRFGAWPPLGFSMANVCPPFRRMRSPRPRSALRYVASNGSNARLRRRPIDRECPLLRRVGVCRGGFRLSMSVAAPFLSGGALVARPWLHFHTPLVEPHVRIGASGSRTRSHPFVHDARAQLGSDVRARCSGWASSSLVSPSRDSLPR